MKTLVITVLALMVATTSFAEDKKDYRQDLEFTCDVTGSDRDGFDVKVENRGSHDWHCDVEVETSPSGREYAYRNRPVAGRSGRQNIGGEAGLTKNLQCRVKSVSCR
ncbi:MAG: hypothetical protein E8D40_16150 [Nitrospira sp.]|nr:MAG: hypothetical protein E8D40_16150 [Nitrospira sp.]